MYMYSDVYMTCYITGYGSVVKHAYCDRLYIGKQNYICIGWVQMKPTCTPLAIPLLEFQRSVVLLLNVVELLVIGLPGMLEPGILDH